MPAEKGKLFEFGAYTGVYLELARAQGWQVSGAELSRWARSIAGTRRKIDLFASTQELAPQERGTFDAVVLWDVIEHVPTRVRWSSRPNRF